jgi:hypothetical protein
MQGTVEYLGFRDRIVNELRSRAAGGGDKTLTAQSNADLATLWDLKTHQLIERNLAFQDTYFRYLENDVVSANDPIGGE